jgi:thiol-disulfide isomerase/thioredoxin
MNTDNKNFSALSGDEQTELIGNIRTTLSKHGLAADAKIASTREVVCNLQVETIDDKHTLSITGSFALTKKGAVDAFKEEVKQFIDGVEGVKVEVGCQIGAGQTYGTIENVTKIDSDEKTTLEHKQGEVWLLDFWATWCPPCQTPMAHNVTMLEKKAEEWKGKVRVIGLSID